MVEAKKHRRIAILGWGSLPWDKRPNFDQQHDDWQFDGPALPPEFSRVSSSICGVLTLVIGAVHGTSCPAAYAISKRRNPGRCYRRPAAPRGHDHALYGFLLPRRIKAMRPAVA
jgi:hypothetical protein